MRIPSRFVLPTVLFPLLSAAGPFPARASEISKRLDKIVKDLGETHKAKRPEVRKESLAVFDLNSSEKLTREKVGFAISELLTQRFVKTETFVVVERAQLHKVFEEQKLQQTGAMDPKTAVDVGKLLGAHILLLGSVEKLGGKYQVNARLVEVKSGEVLAAAYEELPAQLLEEEAKPYLALVPETQAIGLYVGFGYGMGSVRNFTPAPVSGPGAQVGSDSLTLTNEPPEFIPISVGARYSPVRWLMVDLSFSPNTTDWMIHSDRTGVTSSKGDHKIDGISVALSADWVKPFYRTLRAFAGLGGVFQSLGFKDGAQGGLGAFDQEFSFGAGKSQTSRTFLRPFLRLGTEWRPQARLGWSVFANLFPVKASTDVNVFKVPSQGFAGGTSEGPYMELKLPTFSITSTLSVYF